MGNKFESLKEVNNFSEISNQYNALICDIWGVIHNGQELFPGINECLLNFKKLNNVVILLSNAPRPSSYVSSVLDKFGFKDECYDGIITSGDLTKKSLDEKIFGENCYHIGPERDLNIFEGTNVNRVDFNNSDFIFVTGLFNDEIEDENDYLDLLNSAREREMTLVCANPDLLVQRGDKLIPCAGLISKTYEEMGGKVVNIGKPFSPIFKEAIEMVKKNSKFSDFLDFPLYGDWEPLDRCKILVQAPLRISTPGKPNSGNLLFPTFPIPYPRFFGRSQRIGPAEPTDRGANG